MTLTLIGVSSYFFEATSSGGGGGGSSVAFDAFDSAINSAGTTTRTGNFTVGSNTNPALVAMLINENNLTVSTVSYVSSNGGTWTRAPNGAYDNNPRMFEMWYSVGPAAGTTNIEVTWSGALGGADGVIGMYSLYNVDQVTPVDGCQSTASNTLTASTIASAGGWRIAGLLASNDPGAISTGTLSFSSNSNAIVGVGYNNTTGIVAWSSTATFGRGMLIGQVRQA